MQCECVCIYFWSIILIPTQKTNERFSVVPWLLAGNEGAEPPDRTLRSAGRSALAPSPDVAAAGITPSEDSRHTNDPVLGGVPPLVSEAAGLGCFLSAYPWRISRHAELGGDLGGDPGLMRGITHLIWLHFMYIAGKHCRGGISGIPLLNPPEEPGWMAAVRY